MPFYNHDKRKEFLKTEELDSLNYICSTSPYNYYRNIKTPPNLFDTRESFLLKMHDPMVRRKWLNTFNKFN